MPTAIELLQGPGALDHAAWFAALADALLHARLWIGEQPHAIIELEFYYFDTAGEHADPFAHCDALQRGCATWYLHRQGKSYRGGTYKGIDLTFGPAHAYGGILIRSLRDASGRVICGSSLCVDHLLAQTGHASVAALAEALGERTIDDPDNPLRLSEGEGGATRAIYSSARVGLTLKRVDAHPTMVDYVARRQRFVSDPAAIGKGRTQLVIALHQDGYDAAAIAALTGSPKRTITSWIAAYDEGRTWPDTRPLWGKAIESLDLCRLLGALASA